MAEAGNPKVNGVRVGSEMAVGMFRWLRQVPDSSTSSSSSNDGEREDADIGGIAKSEEEKEPDSDASRNLPVEMLFDIFGYLDKDSLMNCRMINDSWKRAADEMLGKRSISQSTQPHAIDLDNHKWCDTGYAKWVEKNVTGTWFNSNEDICEFLESEEWGMRLEDCNGNPFPSRTIIIYMPGMFEAEGKIPTARRQGRYTDRKIENLNENLKRLFTKFGEEIWTCYLIIPDGANSERVGATQLTRIAEGLSVLRSFTVFHSNWIKFLKNCGEMNISWNFPTEMEALQVLGENGNELLRNLFWEHEIRGNEKITELRVGPNYFKSEYSEQRADPFRKACKIKLNDVALELPFTFSSNVTNLKKIVLEDPCVLVMKCLEGLNLEEFSVIISSPHRCSTTTIIPNVLKTLDENCAATLQKLYFHVCPGHFRGVRKGPFLERVKELAGGIKYPNVKVITISYSTVRQWPCLLQVLIEKCPALEKIVFHSYLGHLKKFLPKEENKMNDVFDLFCKQKLFRTLPFTVKTIAVPSMGLVSKRGKSRKNAIGEGGKPYRNLLDDLFPGVIKRVEDAMYPDAVDVLFDEEFDLDW